MFTKSIRWRLTLWLAFLLACILGGFGITAYQLHRTNQLNQIDDELEKRVAALSADVPGPMDFGPPPDGVLFDRGFRRGPPNGRGGPREFREGFRELRLSPQTLSLFDNTDTNAFYFAIWMRGALARSSSNAPPKLPLPELLRGDTRTHERTRGDIREAYHYTELGDCILVGRTVATDLAAMRSYAWWLAGAGLAVLAIGLSGSWLLASRALQPVEEISITAGQIASGKLSERINVAETDSELGRLAGVLNSTFARLEAAFEEQKHFTADASHELRTPLAVIISEAQTALARERSAPEYRETIAACLDTAQQMRRLAESLLQLARLDAGQELQRAPFDLAATIQACVALFRPLSVQRGIRIECDPAPAKVDGDPDRIHQVVANLLDNAIRYNRENGTIRINCRAEGNGVVATIADTGPGISAEDLPHIFERFYRADKSRAHATGGTGLGLAICRAIVEAHGGRIDVSTELGKGSTFILWLPG